VCGYIANKINIDGLLATVQWALPRLKKSTNITALFNLKMMRKEKNPTYLKKFTA
jgi:hypothetical protein